MSRTSRGQSILEDILKEADDALEAYFKNKVDFSKMSDGSYDSAAFAQELRNSGQTALADIVEAMGISLQKAG